MRRQHPLSTPLHYTTLFRSAAGRTESARDGEARAEFHSAAVARRAAMGLRRQGADLAAAEPRPRPPIPPFAPLDRKSTRLNSLTNFVCRLAADKKKTYSICV